MADDDSLGDDALLEEEAPDESSQDLDGGNMDESALEVDGNEVVLRLQFLRFCSIYQFDGYFQV